MQYTVRVYQRNQKKWGKLNDMRQEIEQILSNRNSAINSMTAFMTGQMVGLISRKVQLSDIDYKGSVLVMKKEGFATKYRPYSHVARHIFTSVELLNFLKENKLAYAQVMSKIKNKEKKTLLDIFISTAGNYKIKDISMSLKTNKEIIDGRGFEKKKVNSISVSSDGSSIKMRFDFGHDSERVEMNDWEYNIIKEQLYLPFWKLLTKAKRHALKELASAEKINTQLKKDCQPILMAQQIKEGAMAIGEAGI
jgi:hypothetical protein